MARQLGTAVHSKFDAGYITEATGLNFPPNALVDTENCIVHFPGNLTRRPGFNYEVGHEVLSASVLGLADFTDKTISEFYWQNAAGIGSINFVVVQVGADILFYTVGATTAVSANLQPFTINLDAYQVAGNPGVASAACQFAAGAGYLFIAHPYCDPLYIQYMEETNTITVNVAILQIRDFAGVDDGLAIAQRGSISNAPGSGGLTDQHVYNLYNQGWMTPNFGVEIATIGITSGNPASLWLGYWTDSMRIRYWMYYTATVPSNADVWWRYKDAGGAFNPITQMVNVQVGTTLAPRGFFILDAFHQDRTAKALEVMQQGTNFLDIIVGPLPIVSSGYFRPATIAFFAGRVFYAGVQDPQFANKIYFSRIIERPEHIAQCYQDDDPTSSDTGVADLLASDGGVILSPDFGVVYKLFALAYSLLVFTSKGVWSIAGSTGLGFTATDYSISKISSIPMVGPFSFIDLDGTPVWWNDDGIYTMQAGGITSIGSSLQQVKPMTYSTIKTFFDQIPPESKKFCKGTYNRSLNRIYWLYTSTAPTDVSSQYRYDSILCQNTLTGAFYKWTLPYNPDLDRYIAGAVTIYGVGVDYIPENVTALDTTVVTDSLGDDVTVNLLDNQYIGQVTKFIVIENT